jgi:NADH-quinone oxidoreductase subunit L
VPNWLLLLPIGVPWLGCIGVWMVGDRRPKFQHSLAVFFSVLSAGAGLMLIPYSTQRLTLMLPLGGVFDDFRLATDGLGVFLAVVATVIGSLAVIFSVDYMHGEHSLGRYYAFVLFFIGSMVGLVLTTSLLWMFVFWELTALCSYALIAFHNDDPKAVRGGIKALIMTQFGGLGLLFGALLLYTYTGSYEINSFLSNPGVLPASVLNWMAFGFLIAAAAKSAQFPFQTWLPDAMEAPTPISALIHAATMVNAGVYLLARFYPAFEAVPGWKLAVMIVGMLSALLAALMALVAFDLKRVLAYSTVSQLGFMVYAVGAGGVFASQFHLMSHSVFKALLFLGAGAVIHALGTRDMREMGGLGKRMPFTRTVFILGALALAGLPIFNGFWSKELILEIGLGHGNPSWIAALMILSAGLTAAYTLRMVILVFYGQARRDHHVHDAGNAMKTALFPLAVGSLSTWLLLGPFYQALKTSLPFHKFEFDETWLHMAESVHSTIGMTLEVGLEVLRQPFTYIVLLVVILGGVSWLGRKRLSVLIATFKGVEQAAQSTFGFDAINDAIVKSVQKTGEALRVTQTGYLAWNVLAVLLGWLVVLILTLLGRIG